MRVRRRLTQGLWTLKSMCHELAVHKRLACELIPSQGHTTHSQISNTANINTRSIVLLQVLFTFQLLHAVKKHHQHCKLSYTKGSTGHESDCLADNIESSWVHCMSQGAPAGSYFCIPCEQQSQTCSNHEARGPQEFQPTSAFKASNFSLSVLAV